MTTGRMRVKELAVGLAVSTKDILRALREMGIEAKSQMSSINDTEVEALKVHFKSGAATTKVDRQEILPGQIIRRRRHLFKDIPELNKFTIIESAQESTHKLTQTDFKIAANHETPDEDSLAIAESVTPTAIEVVDFGEENTDPDILKKRKKKEVIITPQVRIISVPSPTIARPVSWPRHNNNRSGQRPGSQRPTALSGELRSKPGSQRLNRSAPHSPANEERERIRDPNPFKGNTETSRKRHGGSSNIAMGKECHTIDFTESMPEGGEQRRSYLHNKKRKGEDGRSRHNFDLDRNTSIPQSIEVVKHKIRMEDSIRVADLAHQMGIKAQVIIKMLFSLGIMATINNMLDIDIATLVAAEFGHEVEKSGFSEAQALAQTEPDTPDSYKPRPPVVTIMGHVDHGKTSLLDAIRKTNVALSEIGGITQHIGAYHVLTRHGEVVFLDTPGHEAFTAMRARGAQITDIVVLVVAADDGVMEQTREALNHSRAAGVPIVVAVNKIDKENADSARVKRELADLGLLPEAWGGETIFASVSAKKQIGIDELLEMILLQAEILGLKANPNKFARGRVIEARLDKGRGAMATLLVQDGTLRQGDNVVCGFCSGRIRALFNDQGEKVKTAGPAIPVEAQGLDGVPSVGDEFTVVKDEKLARRITDIRQTKEREKTLAKKSKVTLESFLKIRSNKTETKNLKLVLKTDVQGSLEAAIDALTKLSIDEVKVKIIHAGVGSISESDITLASASDAIVIGFNVRPTPKIKEVIEAEGIEVRFYDIIYQLVNDIKDAIHGMLTPMVREVYLGQAEVRKTFNVPKVGTIAGCYVADGKIARAAEIRLLRDGIVTYTGRISALKRFKDDAKDVIKGFECGISLEKFNNIKVGDIIEAFNHVEETRIL